MRIVFVTIFAFAEIATRNKFAILQGFLSSSYFLLVPVIKIKKNTPKRTFNALMSILFEMRENAQNKRKSPVRITISLSKLLKLHKRRALKVTSRNSLWLFTDFRRRKLSEYFLSEQSISLRSSKSLSQPPHIHSINFFHQLLPHGGAVNNYGFTI